ncbi:MAG TPA: HEAT repeat domain-containing protein [Anaeromyxobacter sp.]|nr:HEAT repeat domain-containing protein [Anaeromyxobacter sp.]
MTAARDPATVRMRARAPEEEVRYRAAGELDAGATEERDLLLTLLGDPSWRVRSAAVERIASTGAADVVLAPLLAALAGGASVGAREAAAAALIRIGAPAVLPLLRRLDGPDSDLRQAAVAVLGSIGDRRGVAPLAARLADPDPNVRAGAAEALGKIGGEEAGAALLAALDSDDQTMRLSALEALLAMRVCPPAARIEPLLHGDRSLRRPGYRILGYSDEPEVARLLVRGLTEPSRSAREAALAGIGLLRSRRPSGELAYLVEALRGAAAGDLNLDACVESLSAEDGTVAVGALAVLGWVGAVGAVGAMLRLAEDDRLRPMVEEAVDCLPRDGALREAVAKALEVQGPFGRIAALALLSRLGSPAALESLVREASDPNGYLQAEAISALGQLGDSRAVGPLVGLLGDDAPAVSGIAAAALARTGQGSPEASAATLAALRDRCRSSPSASLFRVLGALGSAEDLARLREGLRRPSEVQRVAAAGAISSLVQRTGVSGAEIPELEEALRDATWSVRAGAARAYIEVARAGAARAAREPASAGSPLSAGAVAALHRCLEDAEPSVRAAAVEALGATGQPEHAPAISAIARAPDVPPVVILAALRALAALHQSPVDVISRAAAHPDPEVVKEAVAVAAHLPGPEGERLLRQAAESGRWDVRQAAARAMLERGDRSLRETAAQLAASEVDPLVARAFAQAAQALSER